MAEPLGDASPPGVIWGYDIIDGRARLLTPGALAVPPPAGAFRWIHLDLASQWTRAWLATLPMMAGEAGEMLLAGDGLPHVRVAGDGVAFAVQDFERDFGKDKPSRIGVLGFIVQPGLMISGRSHPLYAPDLISRRIETGVPPANAEDALEMLFQALTDVAKTLVRDLAATVRGAEDTLIDVGRAPDPRVFVDDRRRAVLLHRQLGGMQSVLARAEDHDRLPPGFRPVLSQVLQRVLALDAEVMQVQSNLRQLREEVDMQTASRTNQNLYVLSILSALLLPPTLVTSFFGMNTGGLPFASEHGGTMEAMILMVVSAVVVFMWLRSRGFFNR